ncbi:MAG: c-type cytochrome [Bacillota bacterium]
MSHRNYLCHPQGESGLGPALNNKGYVPSFVIKFQIRNGLGVMPSFSKERISPEELDNLIEYLKALRNK